MNRRQFLTILPLTKLTWECPQSLTLRLGAPAPKFWFGDFVLCPFWVEDNKPGWDKLLIWKAQIIGATYTMKYNANNEQYGWKYALKWVDGPEAGRVEDCDTHENRLAPLGTPEEILEKIAS